MSFSDFYASDLTDITSSDDEDEFTIAKAKASSAKTSKLDQRSSYTIVNALRPPRSTSYSVRALYEQIVDGSINLDPDYQRDVVWPEQKQIGLIDSVFRNYYIPPIIFAVSTTDDGSETRVCIDGKQRLTSIQKFMDGHIPHRDNITAKRYWCKKYGPQARLLLPTPLQQSFANKQIVCVEYDSLTDEQEREIFQRVQLGVALTPAERLQAIAGPWPNFIREIQSQVLGDSGFGKSFDWGRARGRDFHGLASIVYLIEQLPACKVPPTHQTMEKWLTRTTPVSPKLRTGVLDTFRVYLSLAREDIYKKPFAQRVSPIEFVMIGVMIFMKRETLSLSQLSHAVERMRTDVRSVEKDVRSNGRVGKSLFRFIVDKLPKLVLRSDGKGDKSAQSTLPQLPRTPTSAVPPAAASQSAGTATATSGPARAPVPKPKKRKRRGEDNYGDSSSDDEYIPVARKSTGRPPAKVPHQPATAGRPPSAPGPVPPLAVAPSRVTSTTVKVERDKSITPTPSLTPVVSSTTASQSEAHTASAPPVSPPLASPRIKTEKTEPLMVPGPHRTPMDRLAALRAAGSRNALTSNSASASPTILAPTVNVPPDQLVLGSAVAPIDLDALDKLQQILSLSAGLKALSDASAQQQQTTQTPSSQVSQGLEAPCEDRNNDNLRTALALQKLQAIFSLPSQQQQEAQQTQDTPNAIPIPHPVVAAQLSLRPTVKQEPGLSPGVLGPKIGPRSDASLPHRLNYRRRRSRSRDYDNDRGRGHHRRGRSRSRSRSWSRPRSRSRSRSRSWSRSRSCSPSRRHHRHYRSPSRSRSRSRLWDRERERGDYSYHGGGNVNPGRLWRARSGPVGGDGHGGDAVGGGTGGGGPGPGPGPGNGSGARRTFSSPGVGLGFAPRKFDFTRDRHRRERDYEDYLRGREREERKERKASAAASVAVSAGYGGDGRGGRLLGQG